MKVGDLVKLRGLIGDRGGACGTIVEIDEEDYVTVQWWDGHWLFKDPINGNLFTAEDAIDIEIVKL